jgi:hypothetical protein
MKKSILYTIKLGGKNEKIHHIKNLIDSILIKSFFDNFEIHVHYEDNINIDVHSYLENIHQKKIILFKYKKISWHKWLKKSFNQTKNFDYLITLHADCYFTSKHFDKEIINQIIDVDNLGVFTLLDESYRTQFLYPQLRSGFFIDQIIKQTFRFATFAEYRFQKKNWHVFNVRLKKLLNLIKIPVDYNTKLFNKFSMLDLDKMNFPSKRIKTHGIYTHLMGFKLANIKYFNDITDFDVSHGLYADEDICNLSLKKDLINLFIPSATFVHDRPGLGQTRSGDLINADHKKINNIFLNKWGFVPSEWMTTHNYSEPIPIKKSEEIIRKIENKHGKNLTWTKNYNSYDWENFYI